ncbi:MAG: hypothetical protein H7301_02000 [Cryobacterium sp.]|nr:hypothetical protein [Oligoflexia bacterium]
MAGASLRISSLYLSLVISTVSFVSVEHNHAFAEDSANEANIEARAYDVRTIRPSRSGRVYLFEKFDSLMPVDGKIFLLREGDQPIMALRVMRTYAQTKRIAAKKLRAYPGFELLGRGSRYRAFEKLGDKVLPVPPTAEDLQDLKELESAPIENLPTVPVDESTNETPVAAPEAPNEAAPEIPAEVARVSEAPESQESGTESEEHHDEDLELREEAEEGETDHYFPNQFTMTIGNVPNSSVPGPSFKFSGGLLYARKLTPSFALEGGFYYYKSQGDLDIDGVTTTVSMTVIPVVGTLRYQSRLTDLWTGYLYGGVVYPFIANSIGAPVKLLQKVQVISPAVGVGAFLQTGPNWYLRLNFGLDSMTVGVMLRY